MLRVKSVNTDGIAPADALKFINNSTLVINFYEFHLFFLYVYVFLLKIYIINSDLIHYKVIVIKRIFNQLLFMQISIEGKKKNFVIYSLIDCLFLN